MNSLPASGSAATNFSLPIVATCLFLLVSATGCQSTTADPTTITILHFSDYHSHAVPFYSGGEHGVGGIARAIAYLEPLAARDDVLVFSGGDTMNLSAPAWSDKYRCVEWSWWNGILDAMAFGNHDADYGPDVFDRCRSKIDYPILGANVVDARGVPLFAPGGKRYQVFQRSGKRIGVFAVAGSDFETLIREDTSPVAGAQFLDRETTARKVIDVLREVENVDAVVLIGHASTEEDIALARSVPGIDLVLGSHSHRLQPLERIDGTSTMMISPGQYLTHLSRVELAFRNDDLTIEGHLVPMSASLPEDQNIAALVSALQQKLETDPDFAPLFREIGEIERELSNSGVDETATSLGTFVMEAVRSAVQTDVALSTSSSFRGSVPPGKVREKDLRDVLPYDNRVVRATLTGSELRTLLVHVASLRGTDSFAQIAGATLGFDQGGTLSSVLVSGEEINPVATYSLATTDYVARIAPRYREIFGSLTTEDTGLSVRQIVRRALATER